MNKIIPIFVPHKGCPNDCAFCNQKKITGRSGTDINGIYAEKIIKEYLESRDKYSDLAFFGGSFTAIDIQLQIELLEIAYYYKKKGAYNNLRISTRPDAIDEYKLGILKKYGVNIIELGIQSLDDEVLYKSNRGHTAKDSEKASELIKKSGFVLGHQVMPGLPSSTRESDILTCQKSIAMEPNIVRIYPTLIIKDTALEIMYKENKYVPLGLNDAVSLCAEIYSLYTVNNVNVIRIGLQNTDTINEDGDVVAGPFHPAFRQLVEDKLYLDAIIYCIKDRKLSKGDIEIICDNEVVNYVVGHKRKNIEELKKIFDIKKIKVNSNKKIKTEYCTIKILHDGIAIGEIAKSDVFDVAKYKR